MNTTESIPLNESRSLVWLRVIAMYCIVICHLFQAYHIKIWGDIFNVGVQIFFVLSGYLYGYKTIDNWKSWHLKRIKKIYIPYLVFLICVVPLFVLFHNEAMNWKALPFYFANLQGFRFIIGGSFARIEGLRHVWFLTAIMCDYLITFGLQKIKNKSDVAIPILIALIVVAYLVLPLRIVFMLSWVYLYALGYLYVNLTDKWRRFYCLLIVLGFVTMLCLVSGTDFNRPYSNHYRLIHDLGGLFGIIIGVRILSRWKTIQVPKIIAFFDKYSFHVYIVHFFINNVWSFLNGIYYSVFWVKHRNHACFNSCFYKPLCSIVEHNKQKYPCFKSDKQFINIKMHISNLIFVISSIN